MARPITALLIAVVLLAGCRGDSDTPATEVAAGGGQAAAAITAPSAGAAPEGVTVTGQGRVAGQPDTLRATVGVHVVRPDVDTAFNDATVTAERVLEAVRDHGVAEEDIQTREFSVQPEYEYRPDGSATVSGYVVRNLVEITIRDIDETGALLAAVTEVAGDDARIENLAFSLEDNEAQLQAARQAAFEDATAKAEHYAELAGVSLGRLVSITEVSSELPPPMPFAEEAAMDAAGGAPPIIPGEQQVGVHVQATWALQ